jgi:hypothetical protein
VVLQRACEHVASPGPYRVKVTLPVGAKPPVRVAESWRGGILTREDAASSLERMYAAGGVL